jgi:hypothetical protein
MKKNYEIYFIKRDNFSSFYKNPNLAGNLVDFQNSLDNSDYVLCPRGFGNTSMRFYESLSAGRTPILIDSKGGMPVIGGNKAWHEHIVKVDILSNWVKFIKRDWLTLGKNDNYKLRQIRNHELFSETLNSNSYLTDLFSHYLT